jgi:hypothetical protein
VLVAVVRTVVVDVAVTVEIVEAIGIVCVVEVFSMVVDREKVRRDDTLEVVLTSVEVEVVTD